MQWLGVVALAVSAYAGGCAGDGPDEPKPGPTAPASKPLTCVVNDPGPSPLRRLTVAEYNNTVRDLLGNDTAPAAYWISDAEMLGFDNNAAAQQLTETHVQQFMDTAEAVAEEATTRLDEVVPCDPTVVGDSVCADQFIDDLARRAYRRPIGDDDRARLRGVFDYGYSLRSEFSYGVNLVISTVLQSPNFFYRVELGAEAPEDTPDLVALSDHEMATRLSYLLWASMPDATLRTAADARELHTPEQIATQVERMLDDPRAAQSIDHFHQQWLMLDEMESVEKNPATYPEFTPAVRDAMLAGTLAFTRHVALDAEAGDFNELLTANYAFANELTAPLLGVDVSGEELQLVDLDANQRAGIITDLSLMSATALFSESSPVRRGVFVREHLLCQTLPQPPDDVELVIPEINPEMTTRERYEVHTEEPSCASCHSLIDGIGFGFENYDAIGAFRDTENGKPIDASGYVVASDIDGPFDGAVELAGKLADSKEARSCLLTNWFRYAHGRAEDASDGCTIDQLETDFATNGYRIRDLIVSLTQTKAFRYRRPFATESDTESCN